MRHKIILSAFSILLLALLSSSFAKDNEIRYLTGYISNVDDNIITLTNNLAFRANAHVTAMNMTPATFVIDHDRPEGFVYIKNRKIDVTLMKKA